MRRVAVLLTVLALTMAVTAPAGARGRSFPDVIDLPTGIAPEGIAVGNGTEFFTGSLLTGAIYKGNLRTGEGGFINDPTDFEEPRSALGMKHDPRSDVLWVAGGFFGVGYVYDADSGDTLAEIPLTAGGFVNDVVVTRTAAFFTDSFQPVLYRVPLNSRGLPAGSAETLQLTGDFVFVPGQFNGNGIDATPNGKTLVLVNTTTGELYTVNPDTVEASSIDLGTADVAFGDGIVLDGKTLYVVQNFLNQIAVVHLTSDLSSGVVGVPITSPDFRVPTTAAEFGNALYAVNARFDVVEPGDPADGVEFEVVRVTKR